MTVIPIISPPDSTLTAGEAIRRQHAQANARAVEPLLDLIADHDTPGDDRWRAAMTLGLIRDARAMEPLIVALEGDPLSEVRDLAGWALGSIGGARAVERLEHVAITPTALEQVSYVAALALCRADRARAQTAFGTASNHDHEQIRRIARSAIAVMQWNGDRP